MCEKCIQKLGLAKYIKHGPCPWCLLEYQLPQRPPGGVISQPSSCFIWLLWDVKTTAALSKANIQVFVMQLHPHRAAGSYFSFFFCRIGKSGFKAAEWKGQFIPVLNQLNRGAQWPLERRMKHFVLEGLNGQRVFGVQRGPFSCWDQLGLQYDLLFETTVPARNKP